MQKSAAAFKHCGTRLLALDQSSVKTGYALFCGSNLTRWGVLNTKKEKDADKRFCSMCSQIHFMITKTKPDFVVFEKISLHSSVKTLTLLARLQGGIMQSCYINHIDFAVYAPSTWRRILRLLHGGKAMREEHKKRAIAFVRNGYGIKVGDDCAEAICIGVAHLKSTHILTD